MFRQPQGDKQPRIRFKILAKGDSFIVVGFLQVLALFCPALSQASFTFTNDPLTSQVTPVKAVHITELRQASNTLRSRNGLAVSTFTDSTLTASSTQIKAVHTTELRTALNGVYDALGRARPSYTDPTISAGQTVIKKVHIEEIRSAVRAADLFTLTVSRSGAGSGTVTSSPAGISCGSTCSASFNSGTSVTLTASVASGSVFAGWSGGGCSGTGTCTVTMNAGTSVTATFNIQSFALTVSKTGTGSGTVTSSPAGINCGSTCSAFFNTGTSVTLTATPSSGSVFAGWSGGGCSGIGTCSVTVNANTSIVATFAVQQFTLSVTFAGSGAGIVNSSPLGLACNVNCSASFNTGTVVTLSAASSSGSVFAGWSGACTGTGTCTVTMNAARSVTATFNTQALTLAVTRAGSGTGTVTSNPSGINCPTTCSATFGFGAAVTLTATAASGSVFAGWSGACTGTGTPTVTMNADKTCTATFGVIHVEAIATIGPAGGVVEVTNPGSPLFGAKVDIPAGALSISTEIFIASVSPEPAAPPGLEIRGPFAEFGPDGLTFNVPVAITLPSRLTGLNEEHISDLVYEFAAGNFLLSPVQDPEDESHGQLLDFVSNQITYLTDHFSGRRSHGKDEIERKIDEQCAGLPLGTPCLIPIIDFPATLVGVDPVTSDGVFVGCVRCVNRPETEPINTIVVHTTANVGGTLASEVARVEEKMSNPHARRPQRNKGRERRLPDEIFITSFYVGCDGTIVQVVDENVQTQHVGKVPNNDRMIGVEMVQCKADVDTHLQEVATAILIKGLMGRHNNVTLDKVKRHKDLGTARGPCDHGDPYVATPVEPGRDDPCADASKSQTVEPWSEEKWEAFKSLVGNTSFRGSFTGSVIDDVSLPPCSFRDTVSFNVTVTVTGSGTLIDPFTGTFDAAGTFVISVISNDRGGNCYGDTIPFSWSGPVSGSFGKIEVHIQTDSLETVDVTNGVISGNTFTGNIRIDLGFGPPPIQGTLTLTRK